MLAKLIKTLLNAEGKYDKFIIAALSATVLVAKELGYVDIATYVTAIGGAIGVVLVGNSGPAA